MTDENALSRLQTSFRGLWSCISFLWEKHSWGFDRSWLDLEQNVLCISGAKINCRVMD